MYILDAAEKQGVNLPFDCRLGACVACAAKVEAGTVNDVEQVISLSNTEFETSSPVINSSIMQSQTLLSTECPAGVSVERSPGPGLCPYLRRLPNIRLRH